MARSHRQVLRGLALLAILSACGQGGGPGHPPPAAAAPVEACTLFTAEDAQAVLAEPEVVAMTSFLADAQGKKDPAQCGYNAGSDPGRVVRLEVRRAASAERAQGAFEGTRKLLAASRPQEIAGLGDGAFWVGGTLAQLHVRKADTQLIVTSQPGEGKDPLAVAKAIAGKALGRL